MMSVLGEIGFLKEPQTDRKDRAEDYLANEMWNTLSQGGETILRKDLETHLLSILGCNDTENALVKKYSVFKANRLNAISTDKKLLLNSFDGFTFSPKISTTSIQYAESARRRFSDAKGITPIQYNLFHFLNKETTLRTRSEAKARDVAELEHCTFRPKVNKVPQTTYDSENGLAKNLDSISRSISRSESKDGGKKEMVTALIFYNEKRKHNNSYLWHHRRNK